MWRTMPNWRDLEEIETIEVGFTCDLKIDTGDARLWLSRCTTADGEPYDHTAYIELRDEEGRWIDADCYDAKHPPSSGAGWTSMMFRGHF